MPATSRRRAPAFSALHKRARPAARPGPADGVDATSVKRAARLALLRRAAAAVVPAVAIVLDLPADAVRERNRRRPGRVVPDDAVDRQLAELAASRLSGGLEAEGFASIVRLADAGAVDAVFVRRLPRA